MTSSTIPLGRTILYLTVSLVVQTLFFGVYTLIIILSTQMLMKRGLKTQANRILLAITIFMYLLSAAYWIFRVADLISRIQIFIENPQSLQEVSTPVTHLLTLFNALPLINYILCDGVVIWRARLLCAQDHRKHMYLPLFFLALTTAAVAGIIGLRISSTVIKSFSKKPPFTDAINVLQVAVLNMSLISNLSSTGVVAITAWQHRQAIRDGFNKTSKGDQILRILLDSGVLYCLAQSVGLAANFIRLPYGTLGDLYSPVNYQIAGAYTPIVLLLVSTQKSLSETSFLGTICIPDSDPIHVDFTEPRDRIQFGTKPGDPEAGFQDSRNDKDHRYRVSDATPV
ncbi:hypothetical protein MSAN_00056200 [Mycena sanguinolenta]|uniref:Uncharacterized protein n=1 Tax=Mycena sanguinolenta TaxID=230812 RepID=A0A8H7DK69_9AGAR|nr:hypothetical protein MSAN_00056200 [Mycena sanguinolenta]